jgi:hypothetical protein
VGIKTNILAKMQPIVSIGEMCVILMDNINVPAHELHLQLKNGRVVAFV